MVIWKVQKYTLTTQQHIVKKKLVVNETYKTEKLERETHFEFVG